MRKQYLEIGKIVATHGIKGEMKLRLWCDGPDFVKQFSFLYLDEMGKEALKIRSVRPQKKDALILVEGVESIDKAEFLKNKVLYMNRDDASVPEGYHFIQDIIGCKVFDIDNGKLYGIVKDVSNLGASDLYEVENEKKETVLIPAIQEIVKEIDTVSERILICPMKGLFNNED